jgi:hypothetical protein
MKLKLKEFSRNGILLILFGLFFAVAVYQIVMKHMQIEGCDYYNAAIRAVTLISDKNNGGRAYPLWPFGVKVFEHFLGCDLSHSAAYVTITVYVLRFVVSWLILRYYIGKRYNGNICAVLAAVSMIVQHISYEALTNRVTWGLAHINTWHNSTNPVALLFGLCALFSVFRMFEEWEQKKRLSVKWTILFAAANVLADLGKPSFSQVFLPAIVVFCIGYCIKSRFRSIRLCLLIAAALLPSAAVLLWQSGSFFDLSSLIGMLEQQRTVLASEITILPQKPMIASIGVGIEWFAVMGYSWGNIPLVLLGTLAFPIYATAVYGRAAIKDNKMILSWLMAAAGFLEYAALVEQGEAKYHGNFSWGYIISIAVLFLMSIIHFMKNREKGWNAKTVIGVILLGLHFLCGWNYLWWQICEPGFWY